MFKAEIGVPEENFHGWQRLLEANRKYKRGKRRGMTNRRTDLENELTISRGHGWEKDRFKIMIDNQQGPTLENSTQYSVIT